MVNINKQHIACYLILIASYQYSCAHAADKLPTGLSAADFYTGQSISFTKYDGQIRYIDFWASWCEPCRKALPALQMLHKKYEQQGLTVIAVNVDDDKNKAVKFLEAYPVTYLQLYDPKGVLAKALKLRGMPMGYLIDKQNIIRYKHIGFKKQDTQKLDMLFEQLLSEGKSETNNN